MKIQKNVKNILFDLGGVILNIDYNKTIEAFKHLGLEDFETFYSKAQQNHIFDDFETGKLSAEEFRKYLKSFEPSVSDDEIDDAWNAMLLDLPKSRIDLLIELKKKYRLFLLSNTNEIHVKAFTNYIDESFEPNLFEKLFERYYFSNKIGRRKPNEDAFRFVLNEHKLLANETLFIDDSIQHIEGAEKVGLQTYHLPDGETILDLF